MITTTYIGIISKHVNSSYIDLSLQSIISTLGFYKLKHIFTVKNGKTLSISTVKSFQTHAYKKN